VRRGFLPAGLLGGAGGAVGIVPLLPIASGLAIRFASPPALPGALRNAGDIKEATWAEVAVLLVAVPTAALLFGRLLPAVLARLAPAGSLSFEWIGIAFAASFFLAQRGIRPRHALVAGAVLALLAAVGIAAFRRSFAFRRLFARRNRGALLSLALAGASLDLARRAGPGSRALMADLATELLLAAALVPAITAAACRAFRPDRDSALRRLGAAAPIAIALSAATLLQGEKASAALPAAALALVPAAAWLRRSDARLPGALPAALLLLLFSCAWTVLRSPAAPFDLFEDGHSLAFAQSYLAGARPYAETYPVHGWGSDGGVDGFAFRLLGPTLRVYRIRCALWSALSFSLLAASSIAALGPGPWGALGFLLSASFTPLIEDRRALALAALFFLYRFLRSRSRVSLAAAGALAGWEVLYSLEYGLIVVLGAGAGLLLLPTLEARLRRFRVGIRPCALFLAAALLASLPWLILLWSRGVLGDFWRVSFVEIPQWATPAWGLPAGSFWKALRPVRDVSALAGLLSGQGMLSFFLLVLLAVAGAALLLRASKAELEPEDRAAWIGLCVAAFAVRGALGRADVVHLWNYAVFTGLPAAWLLRRAWRSSARGALVPLVSLFLLLRLHPLRSFEEVLQQVEAAWRPKAGAGWLTPPRSGGERISADQARELVAFRDAIEAGLAPGQTFFDFANQPALYFFADRVPPIRFHTVAPYESAEKQQEVLDALEAKRPEIAVFTDSFYSSLDVSNAERAPRVAKYLSENYESGVPVGSWRLARRKRAAD
jgi:hypothetical protein